MAHCDSHEFLTETARNLAEPLPEPPQRLTESARKYWPQVIESKRREAWTQSDLLTACQLCRDLDAVEVLSDELERDGFVVEGGKGGLMPHPAAKLLDNAARRVMAAQKHLQVHAIATTGKAEQVRNKNESARDLARKIGAADNLIPRAGLTQ